MYNLEYTNVGNRAMLQHHLEISHFLPQRLVCHHYPHATILPYKQHDHRFLGGVIDQKGFFLQNSRFDERQGGKYSTDQVVQSEERVVFIAGLIMPAWGHTFTDDLKYLWWLQTEEYKELARTCHVKLAFIRSFHIGQLKTFRLFLDLLRIDSNHLIEINKPTVFKEVYLPDPSLVTANDRSKHWTVEYRHTIDTIKFRAYEKLHKLPTYQKVYLSRTKIAGNRDFGEKYVEKAFLERGYHIIYPEEMTVLEQLWYIGHCDILATTEGSIGHNAVFMKPHARLVVLRKANYINHYQICLNEVQNLEFVPIDANLSILDNKRTPIVGPFFIYVNRNVAKFLSCRHFFPFFEFIRYIIASIFHRDIVHRVFK